ncbi:MAG: 8-amino-7-oxononanoate synthase [Muribaculaceae bacterium]|nr:8-amino-7-oxononanoate synthase [Muribaculaceae bacterium]
MTVYSEILQDFAEEKRLRRLPEELAPGLIDLSSNDYMSLGEHCKELIPEFMERFPDASFSSSASRLLSSKQKYHKKLESLLESLYGKPALLFNSGYHANVGCISALTLPSTLFICDRLIHASIIDGLRMADSKFTRFPHNDINRLEAILKKEYDNFNRIIIVVEAIYSMDGDEVPLRDLVELKRRYPGIMLYLDEAHAFGVRGDKGLGLAEEKSLIEEIDIIVGTLGKAAASAGAFIISSEELKLFFINTARPFIFSTALPPVNAAWSIMMIERLNSMKQEREHLSAISSYFAKHIEEISGRNTGSTSQIIPFLTGDSARSLDIAAKLKEAGFIALPIRRPTVPPGGERIRFSLCSDMKPEDFDDLFQILSAL